MYITVRFNQDTEDFFLVINKYDQLDVFDKHPCIHWIILEENDYYKEKI